MTDAREYDYGQESPGDSREKALAGVICSVDYYNHRDDRAIVANQMRDIRAYGDLCRSSHLLLPKYDGSAAPAILLAVEHVFNEHSNGFPWDESMHCSGQLIKYLVNECGVDLNATYEVRADIIRKTTPLSWAVMKASHNGERYERAALETVKLLHSLGARIDGAVYRYKGASRGLHVSEEDGDGCSLLYAVLRHRSLLDVADYLFSNNARFLPSDPNPMASIMGWNNKQQIIELFKKHLSQLNPRDIAINNAEGGTPLHAIAKDPPKGTYAIQEMVDTLINTFGVSPLMTDEKGKTASQIATDQYEYYTTNHRLDAAFTCSFHELSQYLKTRMQAGGAAALSADHRRHITVMDADPREIRNRMEDMRLDASRGFGQDAVLPSRPRDGFY